MSYTPEIRLKNTFLICLSFFSVVWHGITYVQQYHALYCFVQSFVVLHISKIQKFQIGNIWKQARAELGQAQLKLELDSLLVQLDCQLLTTTYLWAWVACSKNISFYHPPTTVIPQICHTSILPSKLSIRYSPTIYGHFQAATLLSFSFQIENDFQLYINPNCIIRNKTICWKQPPTRIF